MNNIRQQVGDEGLKRCNSLVLTKEEKSSPDFIFGKFQEQLEPEKNYRVNRLKLMSYRQKVEESLDDFVNRCRRLALKCLLPETEREERYRQLSNLRLPEGTGKERRRTHSWTDTSFRQNLGII